MEKIIALGNKTEARDKFTKAIQYSAKILAWSLLTVDKSYHKKFNELYLMARDSRKIFRLFKSIHEIKSLHSKIKDLIWKREKIPVLCEIFSRIGYLIYWVCDNFFILASVKLINPDKMNTFSYIAHMGWLVGILWGLVRTLYDLTMLLYSNNYRYEEREPQQEFSRQREILYQLILIVGKLGDLLPASSGIHLPERILGYTLNDGVIGLGGFVSALVACWGQWNQF